MDGRVISEILGHRDHSVAGLLIHIIVCCFSEPITFAQTNLQLTLGIFEVAQFHPPWSRFAAGSDEQGQSSNRHKGFNLTNPSRGRGGKPQVGGGNALGNNALPHLSYLPYLL